MREQIGFSFSDGKGSDPCELSKFNTTYNKALIIFLLFYERKNNHLPLPKTRFSTHGHLIHRFHHLFHLIELFQEGIDIGNILSSA